MLRRHLLSMSLLELMVIVGLMMIDPLSPPVHHPPRFETLPPGSILPSDGECAARVRSTLGEPRPQNAAANRTPGGRIRRIDGVSAGRNAVYAGRIDGGYTGTTDQILQWGACKWGFDEDIVRAVAVQESYWRQSTLGDFLNGEYQTFGLLQVKRTVHLETWPLSARSTAFNVDYALAWHRACFEGDFLWLNQVQPGARYRAGDHWGCLGAWYSGRWYDRGALRYMSEVRLALDQKVWLRPDF